MLSKKYILLLLEWYDYRIHKGVAEIARENGWQLNCPKNPLNNIEFLKDWHGDGCIALLETDKAFDYFNKHQVPLIDLGLSNYDIEVQRVVTANEEIGKIAAEHFRDQGHRIIFTLSPGKTRMYEERLFHFKNYVEKDGGEVHVLNYEQIQPLIINEIREKLETKNLQLNESSIGFFAFDDAMGAELISLLLRHEISVPENVAILGVDNDDLINTGLTIGLSSVDTDLEGLGKRAAQELCKILSEPQRIIPKSVIRHSPNGVIARQSTDSYAVRNPLIAEALHWIQHNFQRGIQATDVADAVGVTQQGLQKAFRSEYLRSPGHEIRYQRSRAVADLLKSTNATLSEIAKNCGYYSVDTLINGFKTEYKLTPGQYRKQNQSK